MKKELLQEYRRKMLIEFDRLQAIDAANEIGELNRQIYKFHPLKGDREGYWSVTV